MAISALEDRNKQEASYDYQGRTDDRIAAECPEVLGVDRAKCANEIANSEAENYRSYEDLEAQQETAKWAFWMTALGAISTVLTGVGIFLVWQTLGQSIAANEAAQEAIEVTRRMGRLQTQAYVSFGEVGVLIIGTGQIVTAFHLTPRVRNTGQSPALISGLYSYLDFVDPNDVPTAYFNKHEALDSHSLGSGRDYNMAEQVLVVPQASLVWQRLKRCYIMGWAEYATVFDPPGTQHRIDFCFELIFRSDPLATSMSQAEHILKLHARQGYIIRPM